MGKVKWNFIAWKRRFLLNMEDITDADYVHTKRVCKEFKVKN